MRRRRTFSINLDAHSGLGRFAVLITGPVLEAALSRFPGVQILKVAVRGRERVATVGGDDQDTTSRKLRRCIEAEGGGTIYRLDLAYLQLVAVRIGVVC